MIKLSICIPTYNRPTQFKRLMDNLLPQLTDDVEIVIIDDSDNNETERIIDQIDHYHTYIRNNKRTSVDQANLDLLEKAHGDYVWWFSDDDELEDGAVEKVLEVINKNPDFVWVNFTSSGNKAVNSPDRFFKDGNDALDTIGLNIGLLSTLIVKRTYGLQFIEPARDRVRGFAFALLVVIFAIMAYGKSYIIGTPLVKNNPLQPKDIKNVVGKPENNKNFDTFGINFYETVHLFKNLFSTQAIDNIIQKSFTALWKGMVVGWCGGWDTPKGKRLKLIKYYHRYKGIIPATILFSLPRPLVNSLYKFYVKTRDDYLIL